MSPAAQVPGAGGVVFDDAGRVLVLTLARGERVFPKGHLEAGETPLEAAVREVEEETGVKAWCDDPTEFTTSYVNPSGVPRRVTWFVMRCSGQTPRVTESGLTAARFNNADRRSLPPCRSLGKPDPEEAHLRVEVLQHGILKPHRDRLQTGNWHRPALQHRPFLIGQ